MSLPILRFPHLIQKEILRSMDPFSVVVLSIISKRMKRALDAYKYRIDKWRWIGTDLFSLSVRGEIMNIEILPTKRKLEPGIIPFELNGEKFVVRIEKPDIDDDFDTLLFVTFPKISRTRKSKVRVNELISRHLYSFVQPVSTDLHWEDPKVSADNLFVFDMTKKFDYMSLNSGYHVPFLVSPETAKMLMEDVTAEKMDLQIKTEKVKYEFPQNQGSKIKELNLFRTDFIQSNNFVRNLNHPHVKFLFPSIKKWNKILKEWVNEDNNVIEHLMLFRQSMAFFLQASVLAGIPHRETRFKRNQLKSLVGEEKFNEEMMQSYDIRRISDSREATLVFSENSVTLHVWTDAQKAKIRNIHD